MIVHTKRAEAAVLLENGWHIARPVQIVSSLIGCLLIVLQGVCLYINLFDPVWIMLAAILLDLLLLSPLKPGKARFFETLVTDANTAAFSQLFSYFKAGYRQCLSLRIRLWCKRILLFTLCSLPAMLTLYVMRLATAAGEELIGGVLFLVSAFLTVIALVITEIRMFRYLPALYLLPYTEKAATALRVSRKLEGNTTDLWTRLYLDYAGWCFSFLLIFPFFYAAPLFHTARADTAYRLISHNAPRIQKLLLKQP